MKIGVTTFQDDPWEQVTAAAFVEALGARHQVARLSGYPEGDQQFDLLFVIGVRPLWRFKLDEQRLRRHCRIICETGEYSLDRRATFADYYGYFLLNGLNLAENNFRIPRFVRDDLLYPDKNDDLLCIFVDHYLDRAPFLELVVEQIERCPFPHEVLHQTFEGVVRDPDWGKILAEIARIGTGKAPYYKTLPFEEVAAGYRRAHVFMPTHVETVGVVPTEIGACGALTLLPPRTVPDGVLNGVAHVLYDRDNPVDWPAVKAQTTPERQAQHRQGVLAAYGFDNFSRALLAFLETIPSG